MIVTAATTGQIFVGIIVAICLIGAVCWFVYTAFRTTQFVERFVDPHDNAAGEDPDEPDLAADEPHND
jgi:hypothetical protein